MDTGRISPSRESPVPRVDHKGDLALGDLWNFLLRNRRVISAMLVLGVIAGAMVNWLVTPQYEAQASLRIEGNGPINQMESILGPDFSALSLLVETEMGVLRSRTLAEAVVDSLQLMLRLTTPSALPRRAIIEAVHVEQWAADEEYELKRVGDGTFQVTGQRSGVTQSASVGEPIPLGGATFSLTPAALEHERIEVAVEGFQAAVERLGRRIEITRPDRAAAIVQIVYRSADSVLVDEVPNLLARQYMRYRLVGQQTAASSTVVFLRSQLDSLSLELITAENELQAYREGASVVSLQAEASAQVTQLARLQADRNALDAERGALQQLLDVINREALDNPVQRGEPSPYRRLIAFPSLLQNQAASQLLQSLNTILDQRAELLRRRTTQDPDVVSLTSRIEELEDQLRSIAVTYLEGLGNQVAALDRTLARFSTELSRIPAKELAVARLERESDFLREIYQLLQTRLKEAEIAQAAEDPSVRTLDLAVLRPQPVSPRKNLNLLLGALLGLALGVVVAGAKDFFDRTIHTREDLEEATGRLPILGIIPHLEMLSTNGRENGRRVKRVSAKDAVAAASGDQPIIVLDRPHDPVAEAYRALRTSLRFSRLGEAPKTIVLTSAVPRDGKSTTAANLAVALAQQGTRTLLIDADLRRGVLAGTFGQPSKPGLSNVLVGDVPLKEAVRDVDVGNGLVLHLLSCGSFPPNPAELLGSDRMTALLKMVEQEYDAIIVDTAPLNMVTDAAILGIQAGGVILVARAASTDRAAVRYAADQLRGVGARIMGAVLNDVDHDRDGRYGTGYGSYHAYYRSYYGANEGQKATV